MNNAYEKAENDMTVNLCKLREDVETEAEMLGFWENVPNKDGGYVITSRVEGV